MLTFCRCQQYPIDVYYHGYRKKWKEMKIIFRLFSYFAWLEWPCAVSRRIRLKIGNNVLENKIDGSIWKSGDDLDVASAPPLIKNKVVQYDSLLKHWNFCMKHFRIWSIVWVLSLCKLYVPHSVYNIQKIMNMNVCIVKIFFYNFYHLFSTSR